MKHEIVSAILIMSYMLRLGILLFWT